MLYVGLRIRNTGRIDIWIESNRMAEKFSRNSFTPLAAIAGLAVLTACGQPFDYDLRDGFSGFGGAQTEQQVRTQARPQPDSRGVISYPNYQVAVAERGDTISELATRLGLDAGELARFNGIERNAALRQGEVIALPRRVTDPAPVSGATATASASPGSVDIGTLAGGAIDRAGTSGNGSVRTAALPPATVSDASPPASTGEPIRHKVERGETAYTIARLYQVPVKSLAEWNGLGSDFTIREGQYLLIPVAQSSGTNVAAATPVTPPGAGSPTPEPPSASTALPEPETPVAAITPPEPVNVGKPTATAAQTAMAFPVDGSIIREYNPARNSEGIDIKATPGTAVLAADDGTVAAITKSAEGIPIIVVRHDPELLTVYANVTDVTVEKGTRVTRGAPIAKLRGGDNAYVHFEVRQGFDSVDPLLYLQ